MIKILIKNDENAFKLYHKVRDNCLCSGEFRGAAYSISNLRYKTPKTIPVLFHDGSSYDYHFIINLLAKEFDGQLHCLGENTEKYFSDIEELLFQYQLQKNLMIVK